MLKNILALQMSSVIGNFEANFNKVSNMLSRFYGDRNNTKQPDIIFLPEVWTLGWYTECFREKAFENKGAINFLSDTAKKYNVNIVGGSYIREENGVYKNSCPVFNRNGELCAIYDKIHLYSPDGEARAVSAGVTPVIVDIEGLKIGLSICYDIRFPELFRSYIASDNKPDMLVNLSAWPKTRRAQYDAMAKTRAVENQSYFLALSQTGLIKDEVYNSGFSTFAAPLGESMAVLGEEEAFIFETIDTDVVKKVRETFPNLENRKVNDFGFYPKYIKVTSKEKMGAHFC